MKKLIRNRIARAAVALAASSAGITAGMTGLAVATAAPAHAEPVCGYATVSAAGATVAAPIPGCTALCLVWQGPNEINPLWLNVVDVKEFACIQDA